MKKLSVFVALIMCLSLLCACANEEIPDFVGPDMLIDSFGFSNQNNIEADDVKEYIGNNPWHEDMNIVGLPIYKNQGYTGNASASLLLSEDEMYSLAEHYAELLDSEITSRISRGFGMGFVTAPGMQIDVDDVESIIAKTEIADITVASSAEVTITFAQPIPLPEGYSLSTKGVNSETAINTINYLIAEYEDIIDIENLLPETKLWYDGNFRAYLAYADGKNDYFDIVNYNFSRCEFLGDDTSLTAIKIDAKAQYAEYLGEGEIISLEEAKDKLSKGEYLSIYLSEPVPVSDIVAYDLIYTSAVDDEYFIPCYRFFVETDRVINTGESVYSVHYVSAIDVEINYAEKPANPSAESETTYDITQYNHLSSFLALIYDRIPYYYCDNISIEAELKEYIASAELVGTSIEIDENTFPTNEFESNFVLNNSKIYISGDYIIAEFDEPQKWQSQTIYGQVLKKSEMIGELPK